jgi:hypothetical protein
LFLVAKILFFSEEKENKSTKNVKTLKEALLADFPKSGFLSYLGGKSVVGYIPFICLF